MYVKFQTKELKISSDFIDRSLIYPYKKLAQKNWGFLSNVVFFRREKQDKYKGFPLRSKLHSRIHTLINNHNSSIFVMR